jgi:hypothetical protein
MPSCALSTDSLDEPLDTLQEPVLPGVRESEITKKFNANSGLLVAPISGFTHFPDAPFGARQDFAGAGNNSSIIFSDNFARASIIMGLIRGKWLALGGQDSTMGLPITDEASTAFGTGRWNGFEWGRMLWKNGASEAFGFDGRIDAAFAPLGTEWGMLGFPIANQQLVSGFWIRTHFEHGLVAWNNQTLFSWAALKQHNSNNKLEQMGWPRVTSASLPMRIDGTACLRANGAGFPAGKTVEFYLTNPGSPKKLTGTAVVTSGGNFSFQQVTPDCAQPHQIRKLNGLATVTARVVSTGTMAVLAVATSAGSEYTGAPL